MRAHDPLATIFAVYAMLASTFAVGLAIFVWWVGREAVGL